MTGLLDREDAPLFHVQPVQTYSQVSPDEFPHDVQLWSRGKSSLSSRGSGSDGGHVTRGRSHTGNGGVHRLVLKIVQFRFPIARNYTNLSYFTELSRQSAAVGVLLGGGRKHKRRVEMMESAILKFICANQGAVDTDYLIHNLGIGGSSNVSEIISNREKFASGYFCGQRKVVARTKLRLCRARDCQGSCMELHLCKNFLLSESCQFSRSRRGCNFSHELDSHHNRRILREHELESLSRTELCTLLLQSDDRILPPICYDYNNGDGEFGNCQNGSNCRRLHICEKYINRDCSCSKTHDLKAPQPLKHLRERGVPDDLITSLRSVYANIQALKNYDRSGKKETKGYHQQRGGYQGNRGNWGNRGYRGNRGKCQQLKPVSSTGDLRGEISALDLHGSDVPNKGNRDQQELKSSTSDIAAAANDTDDSSDDSQSRKQTQNVIKTSTFGGGVGNLDNQGNHQQLQKAHSYSNILAVISTLDLYNDDEPNEGNNEEQQLKSSTCDISAATYMTDASRDENGKQTRNLTKTLTTIRGRGGSRSNRGNRGNQGNHGNRGNNQQLQPAHSTDDILAVVKDDASSDIWPSRRDRLRPVKDKTEICMYFIKGHCKHGERCFKAHDKMPYRWEVREDDQWTPLPDNEAIEKDYCDPKNSYSSSSPPVYFDTMTCGSNKVRRLSTVNSLLEPIHILSTKWVWYWQDELGKWNMYASANGGHRPADMDSSKLEQKFLENDKDVVEFTAGSHSYSLSFQDMIQTNKQYGTVRPVKRLPLFVSAADVQTFRERKPLSQKKNAAILNHWDKTQIPSTRYKRVPLQRSSDEFKEIEALFCKTMRGFDIVTIERIQNKALWEMFQLQKTQMKKNNGGFSVREEKLFHGTDSKYVDDICCTNFDWRICGTHGTAYGKGSYFARDAIYSHSYTGDSDVKSMFISRLLVGDYTKGSPDYRRPPSKDGGNINFFDSCVDDVMNPSIYVVFEKDQIYPEYLLQYKTTETNTNSMDPSMYVVFEKDQIYPEYLLHCMTTETNTNSETDSCF